MKTIFATIFLLLKLSFASKAQVINKIDALSAHDFTPMSAITAGAMPATSVVPTGNSTPTLASLSLQGSSNFRSNTRNFQVNLGMVSNTGASCTGPQCANVTLYTGMDCQPGTTDCWSQNTLLRLGAGSGSSYIAQAIEVDVDNFAAARGDATGAATFTSPVAYGISLSGAGTYKSTAAINITGGLSTPIWNHGIVFPKNAVQQTSIFDNGQAATVLRANNARTSGIDFSGASFSVAPVVLPTLGPVAWNVAGSPVGMLYGDGAGNLNLGGARVPNVLVRSALIPFTDATMSLGEGRNRWSNLYTVSTNSSTVNAVTVNSATIQNLGGSITVASTDGTVNLQTTSGVQARVVDGGAAPTSYVSLTGGTETDGTSKSTVQATSSTLSNLILALLGKGNGGVLTGAFVRAADPTTTDIPAGQCADWNNTTRVTFKHVCNFGGTLRSVGFN